MKFAIAVATLLFCSTAFALPRTPGYRAPTYKSAYSSPVRVSGHVTRAGTYVAPSYRTAPNSTKTDNWSSKPNVNPYNGKAGTKDPYAAPSYGH
jgi:hypothetical protein